MSIVSHILLVEHKMGRKIPAKKHRGVKDPIKQQERRLKSLKTKINAPPRDVDDQPMPRSIIRLFGLEDKYPEKQKKHNKNKVQQPQKKDTGKFPKPNNKNPVSSLKRMPGESGREFSRRINGAMRALHDGTDVQDYPVETAEEEEDVKGSFMESQARYRRRKAGKQGRAEAGEEKPTRGQLLTQRKKAKKEKALQAAAPELVYERVQFGEVAHAPPTLSRPRKAAQQDGAPRPGRRSLLLHSLLGGAGADASAGAGGAAAGRLRDAPAAERRRRERARELAVAAYRALKNKPARAEGHTPT